MHKTSKDNTHFSLADLVLLTPPWPRMPFRYVVQMSKTYLLAKGHARSQGTRLNPNYKTVNEISIFLSEAASAW